MILLKKYMESGWIKMEIKQNIFQIRVELTIEEIIKLIRKEKISTKINPVNRLIISIKDD